VQRALIAPDAIAGAKSPPQNAPNRDKTPPKGSVNDKSGNSGSFHD
jgi:hypothetical protein